MTNQPKTILPQWQVALCEQCHKPYRAKRKRRQDRLGRCPACLIEARKLTKRNTWQKYKHIYRQRSVR